MLPRTRKTRLTAKDLDAAAFACRNEAQRCREEAERVHNSGTATPNGPIIERALRRLVEQLEALADKIAPAGEES